MKPTDQTVKWQMVLIAAALGLVGFFLEVGPVGGAFSLFNAGPPVFTALALELRALGFLAYLALAASAAVGLHPGEEEPTPKENPPEGPPTPMPAAGEGEAVGERVRVRPELHQMRMLFTAWGGYALLKGVSLVILGQSGVQPVQLQRAFEFGFFYIALGWFVLWQFLRWTAQRKRWIRLQAELVGADITRVIAGVILIAPLIFFINLARGTAPVPVALLAVTVLLQLAVAAAAVALWMAKPFVLRRTIIALLAIGVAVVVLTIVLGFLELSVGA